MGLTELLVGTATAATLADQVDALRDVWIRGRRTDRLASPPPWRGRRSPG